MHDTDSVRFQVAVSTWLLCRTFVLTLVLLKARLSQGFSSVWRVVHIVVVQPGPFRLIFNTTLLLPAASLNGHTHHLAAVPSSLLDADCLHSSLGNMLLGFGLCFAPVTRNSFAQIPNLAAGFTGTSQASEANLRLSVRWQRLRELATENCVSVLVHSIRRPTY